jgi:hypothetical protein
VNGDTVGAGEEAEALVDRAANRGGQRRAIGELALEVEASVGGGGGGGVAAAGGEGTLVL